MAHTPTPDWATIDAYLAETLSPAERVAFEEWRRANPREWAALQRVGRALRVGGGVQDRAAIAAFTERVQQARVAREAAAERPLSPASEMLVERGSGQHAHRRALGFSARNGAREGKRFENLTLRRMVWSAGSIIVAALLFVVMTYRGQINPAVAHAYTTRAAQQATITLSDGTRVTLAPQTTLRLVRFGASSRDVVLDGQAYFEVARTAGTPFLVHTGSVTTQVLGTAFLVRHYAHEDQIHVAVTEGKVALVLDKPHSNTSATSASRVALTAGYVGDVTDSTVLTSKVDDLTGETGWLRGRLVFQHTPVSQVLLTLSRWYGYQFRCVDSVLTRQNVTVSLDGRSSAAALAMLEQLLEVRLTVTGDTVTLTPRQSRSTQAPAHKQEYDIWIPTREVGR